jgi:Tol biopolymer transport system component
MKIPKPIALLFLLLVSCSQATTPVAVPTRLPSPTNTFLSTTTLTITPSPVMYPTQVYGLMWSPDGTKKVQSLDWNNYEVLTTDGKVLWKLSYENKLGAFEPGWNPFFWSTDGKYIYFTCYHGPDDGSTKFFGNDQKDGDCVYRFDIETGELFEIIPEIDPGYYAFTISSDGNQLIYANQTETPVKIKLLDLKSLKERVLLTADENVLEIGSFGWSPKMDEVIFTTLKMADDEKRVYSIFLLDLKNLKTQVLISGFNEWLGLESWDEQGRIIYRDTYRAVWELNLQSKKLMPLAVPTLTLSP